MGIYEELQWRGLIKDVSDPSIKDKLNAGGMTFYIGTDPTGDSLHIGHFSSFLICKRLKDAGHHPIVLVGGAAILTKYRFREMTTDIDAIIRGSSSIKDAINHVGDKFDLSNGWINADFMHTSSYSPKLDEFSKHYKSF